MKIALIQAGLGAGGAEKNIALLAEDRVARGDEVHVIAMTSPPGGSYFRFPDAVTLHVAPPPRLARGPLAQVARTLWIRNILRRLDPDVAVSFLTKINIMTLAATIGTPLPVVVSERNNPEAQGKSRLWHHLGRLLLPRATAFVMQTGAARDSLPKALRDRASVIFNPATPLGDFAASDSGGKRLVAVGRLDVQKGFDLLIEAFARIAPDHPDATLTIFGEGAERAALEAQVRDRGLDARVSMPGTTSRPGEWIAAGDILVLSSRYEGFPNVLCEATIAGMPCIAFACDHGPSEILTDMETGLLVPREDVPGLATAMETLLSDPPLRTRLGQAATINRQRFAIGPILAQWDKVLTAAAAG